MPWGCSSRTLSSKGLVAQNRERRQPDERPDRCVATRAARYGAGARRVPPARGAAPDVRGLRARVLPPARRRRPRRARARGPVGRAAVALAVRRHPHAGRAEGARAQPHAGRGRLGLAPLGDRDRQRRHAVPGRLDHDGDQPAGADAAPDRASDLRGRARRRRAAGLASTRAREAPEAARESWMHVEVDRLVDAQQRSDAGRGHRARARRRARRGRGLEADAGAPAGGDRRARRPRRRRCRQRRSPKAAPSCNGWPTTTSRCSAIGATTSCRSDGEDGLRLVPGSGLGVLRETAAEQSSASFAALPPQAARPARATRCRCWW